MKILVRRFIFLNFLTISRRQILDSSILKEFVNDNFTFDENGRKLSKRVENTVGKGEITRSEQFLFFPQCFQKACFPGASKGVIVWEWVKIHFLLTKLRNRTLNAYSKSTKPTDSSSKNGFIEFNFV